MVLHPGSQRGLDTTHCINNEQRRCVCFPLLTALGILLVNIQREGQPVFR